MCDRNIELKVLLILEKLGLLYQIVLRNPNIISVSLGLAAT